MKLTNINISKCLKTSTILFILLFSSFLYIFKNTNTPVSLYSDEADINYQAYIFNKQSTDYFGNKFPVHFHSYADFQPSFYIYSVALIQKFIGHTDSAVRIPAAIFSVLTIFVFFLILKHIFNSHYWGILGAFLLSITPWLFHFSRSGFAVTNMLFLTLLGIYFWLKFLSNKQNIFIYLSLFSFSLLTYSYSTAKLHLVLLFITAFIIWFKEIYSIPFKTKFIAFLLVLIITFPVIVDTLKGNSGYRFAYINIFSDPTVGKTVDFKRQEDSIMKSGLQINLKPSLTSKIFHNKIIQWKETFAKNYFSSFSTEFLFTKGDNNLRQGTQNSGNLLIPDFFFIIIGLISIFTLKSYKNNKFTIFALTTLLLSPIPFSLTRDSEYPHATRLILMLPFLVLLSIFGIKKVFEISKSKLIIFIIIVCYILNFSVFLDKYYYHYPNLSARDWHFGMKEAVLNSYNSNHQKIYYSSKYEPFMPFFLNYSEYQPKDISKSPASSFIWDNNKFFTGMQSENKYYLGHIEWSDLFSNLDNINSNYLYVVPSIEIIRIEDSLKQNDKIKMTKISQTAKIYSEQETFYLISFNI